MENEFKQSGNAVARPRLSICIATYNRGGFIGETLDSILSQMQPGVELVVVDGASPDNTSDVMAQYLVRYPEIRYYREQENSGVDGDYDKAVGYARGEYCWLMTDDDLLLAGSVGRVLGSLGSKPALVVVNAEVKNAELSAVLNERMLKFTSDREYGQQDADRFFAEVANYLSFIGGVVINRQLWLERDRASYYGTLFIHVGVIFQHPPMTGVQVIADPLIVIRYGNAMWSPRGFEIWMFKWPQLIRSFADFSEESKRRVCVSEPWRNWRGLIFYRATGAYSVAEFYKFISHRLRGLEWLRAYLLAIIPASMASLACIAYFVLARRTDYMVWYDLLRSRSSSRLSRWVGGFARNDKLN